MSQKSSKQKVIPTIAIIEITLIILYFFLFPFYVNSSIRDFAELSLLITIIIWIFGFKWLSKFFHRKSFYFIPFFLSNIFSVVVIYILIVLIFNIKDNLQNIIYNGINNFEWSFPVLSNIELLLGILLLILVFSLPIIYLFYRFFYSSLFWNISNAIIYKRLNIEKILANKIYINEDLSNFNKFYTLVLGDNNSKYISSDTVNINLLKFIYNMIYDKRTILVSRKGMPNLNATMSRYFDKEIWSELSEKTKLIFRLGNKLFRSSRKIFILNYLDYLFFSKKVRENTLERFASKLSLIIVLDSGDDLKEEIIFLKKILVFNHSTRIIIFSNSTKYNFLKDEYLDIIIKPNHNLSKGLIINTIKNNSIVNEQLKMKPVVQHYIKKLDNKEDYSTILKSLNLSSNNRIKIPSAIKYHELQTNRFLIRQLLNEASYPNRVYLIFTILEIIAKVLTFSYLKLQPLDSKNFPYNITKNHTKRGQIVDFADDVHFLYNETSHKEIPNLISHLLNTPLNQEAITLDNDFKTLQRFFPYIEKIEINTVKDLLVFTSFLRNQIRGHGTVSNLIAITTYPILLKYLGLICDVTKGYKIEYSTEKAICICTINQNTSVDLHPYIIYNEESNSFLFLEGIKKNKSQYINYKQESKTLFSP